MEADNFEEAIKFLRSALHQDADVGRISRYDVERALEHVIAGKAKADAIKLDLAAFTNRYE